MSPTSKPTFFHLHWLLVVMLTLISACTPSSPVPTLASASEPFEGRWTAAFTLEENTRLQEKNVKWLVFNLQLQQQGDNVIGALQGQDVDVTGIVNGTVDDQGVFRGSMRLSWDDHDWDSLMLSLSPDGASGSGTAIFRAAPDESHFYSINLLQATAAPYASPTIVSDVILSPTPNPAGNQRVQVRWLLDEGAAWRPDENWIDEFNASQNEIELSLMFNHGDLLVVDTLLNYHNKGIEQVLPDIAPFSQWDEYGMRDSWLDLRPYLQEYDLSDFDPAALHQWQDESGKQFGLPVTAESMVLFYNRDLFDAAGIPYPPARYGEPYADGVVWDIDKLQEIAIQLTLDGNGRNPTQPGFEALDIVQWGFAPGWLRVDEIAALFGPEPIFDENQNVRLPDSWREAMRWYYSGMWEQHFIHTGKDLQTGNMLPTGRIAMVLSLSWYASECCNEAHEQPLNWDMAAVPSFEGRISGAAAGSGLGILKTTAHPQEAVRTLYYIASLPALVDSRAATSRSTPAQISRRNVYLAGQAARFPQSVNWQIIIDGFAHQETPGALSPKAFEGRISSRLDDFRHMIETTAGLDIEAALDDLETRLQNVVNTSTP